MLAFRRNFPQISAGPHQLDFTPYASGSYSAQWNSLGHLHDMHMLCSSRILRKMEVEETKQGLWLSLNYRIDIRASLAYDTGIWGESYRLFVAKFLFGWCFGSC